MGGREIDTLCKQPDLFASRIKSVVKRGYRYTDTAAPRTQHESSSTLSRTIQDCLGHDLAEDCLVLVVKACDFDLAIIV